MADSHGVIVPGEGPDAARAMLVGQNPGKEEVKQGRPFVGRSGRYLTMVLDRSGIDRKELYITSVVKEPTPGNRKPTVAEITRWMPALLDEIECIKPRIIVLMGEVARGIPRRPDIEYLETYYSAAAMRFPKIRQKFEKDMEELAQKMRQSDSTFLGEIA